MGDKLKNSTGRIPALILAGALAFSTAACSQAEESEPVPTVQSIPKSVELSQETNVVPEIESPEYLYRGDFDGHQHYSGDWNTLVDLDEEAEALVASWRSPEKDAAVYAYLAEKWPGYDYDTETDLLRAALECQWLYDGHSDPLDNATLVMEQGVKSPLVPMMSFYCDQALDEFFALKVNGVTMDWNAPGFNAPDHKLTPAP
ncbi:hypothetical protein [Arthrobacter sp. IK3]|uniref:hypothetical protein n=1 Tax=Arthrobacter sp. IK3 TaxID=3448169 RepID=UPI003EE38AE6